MNLLICGIFACNLTAMSGATLMHGAHGFCGAGLFALVGQIYDRFYTRNLKYLRGLAESMPLASTAGVLLVLANCAVPGTFNFIGEALLLCGVAPANPACAALASTSVFCAASAAL